MSELLDDALTAVICQLKLREIPEDHSPHDIWLNIDAFESLAPGLTYKATIIGLDLVNPFARDSVGRYSGRERSEVVQQKSGAVNGYLKFTFGFPESSNVSFDKQRANFGQTTFGIHHPQPPSLNQRILQGFAAAKLDSMDQGFLRFCNMTFSSFRLIAA